MAKLPQTGNKNLDELVRELERRGFFVEHISRCHWYRLCYIFSAPKSKHNNKIKNRV